MKKSIVMVCLTTVTLAACGGGTDTLTNLLDQAAAKKSEAQALAVDTPCAQSSECSILVFSSTASTCPKPYTESDYKIYSLISATATQAKEAAAQYDAIAAEARELQTPAPGTYACPAVIYPLPTPVCIANKCIAAAQ